MSTSRVFTKNVGEIIEESLRDARIIAVEQPVLGIDFSRGLTALNNIAKFWQNQDINLWLMEEAVLPLVTDQRKYVLGPNGAECANADVFFNTTSGAAHVTNDTVITVTSSANMVAAVDILTADPTDSTQDWDAINSATLSVSSGLVVTNVSSTAGGADYDLEATIGQTYRVRFDYTLGTSSSCAFSVLNGTTVADTVTLSSTTADNELTITATSGTIVFRIQNVSTTTGHTSTVANLQYVDEVTGSRIGIELDDGTRYWDNVLNVDSSTSIDIVNGITSASASGLSIFFYTTKIDRPMRLLGARYSDSITGSEIPTDPWSRDQYFDQPDKGSTGTINSWYYSPQLTDGDLYIWQVAGSVKNIFRFSYMQAALVYTETSDNLAFPSEFFVPLKWAIAAEVGPSYGVKTERQLVLESKAVDKLEEALGHDTGDTSMMLQPDFD
jgi:hypothetical protein